MTTVFLRTALFSFGGDDAHVPTGSMIIRGELLESEVRGMLRIRTSSFLNERGHVLSETELHIDLPLSKVDHILPNIS